MAAAAAVFGAAWLVLAYSQGYYDLSFLDRSDLLDEIPEQAPPSGNKNPKDPDKETEADEPLETGTSTAETKPSETTSPSEDRPSESNKRELGSVIGIYNTDDLADVSVSVPLLSTLTDYKFTDQPYQPSEMLLAKMQFNFKLPETFSLRKRLVDKLRHVVYEENGPYSASYYKVNEDRPAVELYMGMILIDTGDLTVIVNADGVPLCSFDDSVYKPAYTRDKSNRPLFVKEAEEGKTAIKTLGSKERCIRTMLKPGDARIAGLISAFLQPLP